jgi:hypothetical protein
MLVLRVPETEHKSGHMTISHTPSSAAEPKLAERRLNLARKLYRALVAQDTGRVITLRDCDGRVVARHDPRPEQSGSEIAS